MGRDEYERSPPSQLCRSSHHAGRRRSPVLRAEKNKPTTSAATARIVATMPVARLRYHHQASFIVVLGNPSGGANRGIETVTRRPAPGAVSTRTLPPWAATMAATIGMPSPAPPDLA